MYLNVFVILTFYIHIHLANAAYTWPNLAYDYIEEFLWRELTGFAGIPRICGPTTTNPDGTTASIQAQWLRTAYHDMATFNNGVGGLDGSIIELDRAENVGAGLTATRGQFVNHISKYTSMPDLIAAGAILAVSQCGGPSIPFKPGRIMASAAGPAGVPVPEGTLASHIAAFQRQGFTATEMIGLVACGHTLGGVTAVDFPAINTGSGIAPFDDTRLFDNHIATNYINGPNINPLVKGPAATDSETRIFASDGNATMRSFASSASTFSSTCGNLIGRMINTVPTGVTLRDPVVPIPFKPRDYLLSLTAAGTLNLKVTADIFGPSVINSNRVVTLKWADRRSSSCASGACCASPIGVTTNAGLRNGNTLQSYSFSVTVSATVSFSSFWFTVDEVGNGATVVTQNNGGGNYPVDDLIVYVPAYSCALISGPNIARVTTAVRIDGTTQPSSVSVESMFRDTTLFKAVLTTVPASLGTAPYISPVPQYAFYTALVPGDVSLFCQYLNFEYSAVFGGVTHTGPIMGGACNVRALRISTSCSTT
ncbi:heme peroxidase [Lyophyllum atratum]|nr:heme peroxidase [Lyophyllum atratum]